MLWELAREWDNPLLNQKGPQGTVKVKVAQSGPALCDPVDLVLGILQARILEWIPFPFSRESFQPWDEPRFLTLHAGSLPSELQGKPKNTGVGSLSLLQWIQGTGTGTNHSVLGLNHIPSTSLISLKKFFLSEYYFVLLVLLSLFLFDTGRHLRFEQQSCHCHTTTLLCRSSGYFLKYLRLFI